MIYMGKDKYENEHLIQYGLPEDVWFRVDDLSSAHVYLRLQPGMQLADLEGTDVLLDCASLVKANSIAGCKKASVNVIYTRWKNLKKTNDMVDGQVGYHRPDNVKRVRVEKNNSIVKQIEKSKKELYPDLAAEQAARLKEIQLQKKNEWKKISKEKQKRKEEAIKEKEARSYDRIMVADKMTSNAERVATVDTTAAEEFEDDFF